MSHGYAEALRQRRRRVQHLASWIEEHLNEPAALVLEIGCGHGHFLTAYASAHPEEICVGIDLVTKRIEKGNAKAKKRGLTNLHFLKAELTEFLEAVPEALRFERAFMLFPDPWPKKRHFKNRMIQPAFLDRLAEITTPDAEFCFRTDHDGLFQWTLEHLAESSRWVLDPEAEWPLEERSYFQDLMESWQSLVAVKRVLGDPGPQPDPKISQSFRDCVGPAPSG